jgi:hypothetical protein
MSWPYLNEAYEKYKAEPNSINGFILILSFLAVIPGGGKPFGIIRAIVKFALIIKFFPVWLIYKLISRSGKLMGRVPNIDDVLFKATNKLDNVKFKDGQSAGTVFRDVFKQVYGKTIPKTIKGADEAKGVLKPVSKVAVGAKAGLAAGGKTASKVLGALNKGTAKGLTRTGAGLGTAGILSDKEKTEEEKEKEKQDFLDFLKDLLNSKETPASGTRETPIFGKIGAMTPAKY